MFNAEEYQRAFCIRLTKETVAFCIRLTKETVVSQLESYSFLHGERGPNDTAKRERESGSNHPENVSLIMLRQGVLPRQHHLRRNSFKGKNAWKRTP